MSQSTLSGQGIWVDAEGTLDGPPARLHAIVVVVRPSGGVCILHRPPGLDVERPAAGESNACAYRSPSVACRIRPVTSPNSMRMPSGPGADAEITTSCRRRRGRCACAADWLRSTPAQFDESTALLLLLAGDGPGGEEVARHLVACL